MPLYSFHCAKCDSDVELLVGCDDKPACPHCRSKKLQRLVSRVVAPGKSGGLIKAARAQAAREGHFSNYSRSERRG
ncbi:FmdB family zinc ribbon protein [Rhodopseudomonas palustris]|uniref:Putative regulatory protein FmdB zinc ribbon domain-containing protein n=1 Tax=Rhodopseudomonas palustris (strain BisB18) TaxID=316056 RepID=Q21C91_RHOPB